MSCPRASCGSAILASWPIATALGSWQRFANCWVANAPCKRPASLNPNSTLMNHCRGARSVDAARCLASSSLHGPPCHRFSCFRFWHPHDDQRLFTHPPAPSFHGLTTHRAERTLVRQKTQAMPTTETVSGFPNYISSPASPSDTNASGRTRPHRPAPTERTISIAASVQRVLSEGLDPAPNWRLRSMPR